METVVDPAQHIPLIHRVIGQLGLYGDMKEEAYSESLVTLVEAAQSYDPSRGVPLANWLGQNIRWKLATWIAKQKATVELTAKTPVRASEEALSACTELTSLLGRMQVLLTQDERLILLYSAAGYKGIEIAKMSGLSPVQVSILKTGAQRKLREAD